MELIHGDCIIELEKLIKKQRKVDMVITSPPYNMNYRVNKGRYLSRGKDNHKEFSRKYTDYTDDLPMDEYYEFQKKVISQCLTLSDTVFYNIQLVTGNKVALFDLLGYYSDKIKEVIIWDKGYGQPAIHEGVLNSQYEYIIIFQNSKPYNRSFDKSFFNRGTLSNLWRIPS